MLRIGSQATHYSTLCNVKMQFIRIVIKNPISTSQNTYCVSSIRIDRAILFRDIREPCETYKFTVWEKERIYNQYQVVQAVNSVL
jgi:hypothetical protein